MTSLISIVVPVYNVEAYLERSLDSLLSQSYENLEIILIDDGSSDKSGLICDAYAQKDSRIVVVHQKNGGVAEARNAGLRRARGEYLLYVDADDYLSEDAVKRLYERILRDQSDLVIGKHSDVYEDGSCNASFCDWMTDSVLTKQELFTQQGEKHYYALCNWAKLSKIELWKDLRYPKLCCGEDAWMFPLLMDRCERISVLDETVYFYFQRTSSLMHEKSERSKADDLKAILHLVDYLEKNGYRQAAKKWFAIAIDKALKLKETKQARCLLKSGLDEALAKGILKELPLKHRLKWTMLYAPAVYKLQQSVKRVFHRG